MIGTVKNNGSGARSLWARALWSAMALALISSTHAGTFNTDPAIATGFASLLSNQSGNTKAAPSFLSGSEDFWLRQSAGSNQHQPALLEHVVWRGPVAAGGTLVIGSGSARKELEVIAIEHAAEATMTRIDMSMAPSASLRVQARDGQNIAAPAVWLELTSGSIGAGPVGADPASPTSAQISQAL